jgi:WD40 repeat protein
MPEGTSRRFLIATGVTAGLPKTGARLADSVGSITGIFHDKFGYERVTPLDINPSREEMRQDIRAFAKKCAADDFFVVYHTGHADIVAGRHRLWMGDTVDSVTDTLVTSELAELILVDTPVRNLLIILDTCFAGQGGTEALQTGFTSAGDFSGKTLLAITSAHPREQVRAGDFVRLFERSVDHPATAGYEPRYLSIPAIVGHMNKDLERKSWQTVSYSTVLGTDDAPFLPNPRYDTAFHGFDLATQAQMEQDEQRRQDLERFFNPRARGVDVPQETGWNFVGRHVALRDLTAWLVDRQDRRSLVVTGDPGSGKSAVIGRLAILSHRDWGRTVPRHGLPPDTVPPMDSISVAIHARNRTGDEVLQALCAAAHVTAATSGEFLRKRADVPMVAAIDAIDEAVDPERLVVAILNPLMESGPTSGFRLLLGTRSYLLDRLNPRADRIDLDDQRYADPGSLRVYTERMLRVIAGSPYARADAALVHSVAQAVARAAGRSFLVALITSRTLAALGHLMDPADPLWQENLPATAAQAMHQDLETRLRGDADRARDLLRPLAYAGGNGLPWEDIWAPLASSLTDRHYRDEDLIWLRRNAGSYVVEALESGRSVYRLYHAALAEYLRHDNDDAEVNGKFVNYLLSQVPLGASGERDWAAAHPYTLSHLATHAAAAGELGGLVSDPCYLASAAPHGLLAAFPMAREPEVRQVAVAYERAMHRLRTNDLADRLSYLELAAHRAGAVALAERIAAYPLPRRWFVRWVRWPQDHPHRVLAGHQGPVREVVSRIAEDGTSQAASVGDDGTLRLWDLNTAESVSVHQVSDNALMAVDLIELPDGKNGVLVLSAEGVLSAYELPSMSPVLSIPVHSGFRGVLSPTQLAAAEMRCVRLPDGTCSVVTGGPGMMTTVWDIRQGKPIVRFPGGVRPSRLEFRIDEAGGLTVVSLNVKLGVEEVFDLETGRRIRRIRNVPPPSNLACYWKHDGTPVMRLRDFSYEYADIVDLTAGDRDPAVVLRVSDGAEVRLRDGSQVSVTFNWDTNIWSPRTRRDGENESEIFGRTVYPRADGSLSGTSNVRHAQLSKEFPYAVNVDGHGLTLSPMWASALNHEVVVLTGHGADVTDAAVVNRPKGTSALISCSSDGTVRFWDVAAGDGSGRRSVTSGPSMVAASAVIDPDRAVGVVIGAASEERVSAVDLASGRQIAELDCASGSLLGAACVSLPDVSSPAAITFEVGGTARLWNLSSGRHLGGFGTHFGAVRTQSERLPVQTVCVPLLDRPLVVTCGHGTRPVAWDLVDKRIHNVFSGHTALVSAVACVTVPDGRRIAVIGGQDNKVSVWDVIRGRRIAHFSIVGLAAHLRHRGSGHPAAISLVVNESGRLVILILCEDGKLRIYRKRRWHAGYQRRVLDVRGASSLAVMRLSDGGDVALTGGQDGCLSLWDLDGFACLLEIQSEVSITNLSVVSDQSVVVSTLKGLAAFSVNSRSLALMTSLASREVRTRCQILRLSSRYISEQVPRSYMA